MSPAQVSPPVTDLYPGFNEIKTQRELFLAEDKDDCQKRNMAKNTNIYFRFIYIL